MRSIGSSRGLFGCTRSSLITAVLVVGTLALAGNVSAQDQPSSSKPTSMHESPAMAMHAGASTSLSDLVQEAEQKNPQIAASFHGWQASRNVAKQASALPETQLSVQQFSVGSPRPFAGYSNSEFAYIGFGASQDIPYPGKRQLRAQVAEHGADSIEAQTDSVRRMVVGNLKVVYFQLAYIQQTIGVLQRSDALLNQVQEASEARYRVGQGNQQDVLKAQLQHTKILQQIAHHHQDEGLLEAQIKQLLGRPQDSPEIIAETLTARSLSFSAPELLQEANRDNPDLRSKQASIQQQDTQVELAHKNFRPDFNVQYAYQHTNEVDRPEAAKYGLTIADVQLAVTSGMGGMNIAQNVEGRERYPINVRYDRDFRDNIEDLHRILIATPAGAQIPIEQVAEISFSRGPAMIRDEEGQLTGYVYIDLNTKDYGGFVDQASKLLRQKLTLPAGYIYTWSGEYEFELRAKDRFKIILPIVFVVIFLLLYLIFHSVTEAVVLIFPTFYAMTGGLILQWLLGYNFSVAVWVGYIALFGIAVETGVVMVVYLHEALDHKLASGVPLTNADIEAAAIEGAVHRLRPKLMTVTAVLASLIPILFESGIGSDVMKPIAAPIVGGMITSTIHVLILVPVFFVLMKERALRHGTLTK